MAKKTQTKNAKTRGNYRTGICFDTCMCLCCRRNKAQRVDAVSTLYTPPNDKQLANAVSRVIKERSKAEKTLGVPLTKKLRGLKTRILTKKYDK